MFSFINQAHLRFPVGQTFKLADIVAAHHLLDAGHVQGKLIVTTPYAAKKAAMMSDIITVFFNLLLFAVYVVSTFYLTLPQLTQADLQSEQFPIAANLSQLLRKYHS